MTYTGVVSSCCCAVSATAFKSSAVPLPWPNPACTSWSFERSANAPDRVGGSAANPPSCQFKPTCHGCFVAASLFAIGFGLWAASTSNARVTPATGQGIEPFQLMMNAKDLPAVEFADHTFVFH